MFKKVFIEEHLKQHPRTLHILEKLRNSSEIRYIENIQDIWGRVKKPYLQKRNNLNLFIGEKKGELLKEAPDAYGTVGDKHYYFIHAYNCIYECTYCYLQGYFNTPDMVFFINHEDIIKEIIKTAQEQEAQETVWFHAGEFSDSLALSHITGELDLYFDCFRELKNAKLELRTKSSNIKLLKDIPPSPNVITSLSIATAQQIKENDLKTPPLKTRLKSLAEISKLGHPIALHLDPIIYQEGCLDQYRELLKLVTEYLNPQLIQYISIGVVRFTKDVYFQVQKNYPEIPLHQSEFIKSFDGKIRYNRPMRSWILNNIKQICLDYGIKAEQIYQCMED